MDERTQVVTARFRVTKAKLELIDWKTKQLETSHLSVYMRKMAVGGYVINAAYRLYVSAA